MGSKFFNQKGVTLVETVVAAAILGGIALVVMRVSEQSNTATIKQEYKSDVVTIINEMNTILSDPKKCIATFRPTGTVPPDDHLTDVEAIAGSLKTVSATDKTPLDPPQRDKGKYWIESNSNGADGWGGAKVRIESLKLMREPARNRDYLEVKFVNRKALKRSSSDDFVIREINLYAEYESGKLKTCRALTSATPLIWTRGSGDDIYYSGGNVGINTDTPDEALHVVGKMFISDEVTAKSFMYASDMRLKKNTQTISSPIEKIMALRGVSFDWKKDQKHDYGFIAQEVQRAIPEIVRHNTEKNLAVDYVKVLPFLLEGIKQQQIEIDQLEEKINQLNSK